MTDQLSGVVCSIWASEQLLDCQDWPKSPARFAQHLGLAVCLHKTKICVSEAIAADVPRQRCRAHTMYDVQFLWALENDSHTAESSALPGILVSCKDHMSTCRSSVFLIKVLAKAVGGK